MLLKAGQKHRIRFVIFMVFFTTVDFSFLEKKVNYHYNICIKL